MTRTPRLHLDAGPAEHLDGARLVPCSQGFIAAARVTDDREKVTCRACLTALAGSKPRKVRKPRAAKVATLEPEPPPFVQSAPYEPPPAARELDDRDLARIEREDRGEDEPLRAPFRTPEHAFTMWFAWRLASKLRPAPVVQGSEDKPRSDRDDRARLPGSDRAVIEGHASVLGVDVAIDRACADGFRFFGDKDGKGALAVSPHVARRIFIAYREGRSTPGQIAEAVDRWLDVPDETTTDHQVGIVYREVCRRAAIDLGLRGLIRRARAIHTPEVASSKRDKGADVALLPDGFDIDGWKGVASALGYSEGYCRALTKAAKDPLPVSDMRGRIVARSADLRAWVARQVKPKSGAAA